MYTLFRSSEGELFERNNSRIRWLVEIPAACPAFLDRKQKNGGDEKDMEREKNFTQGSILRSLLLFAFPVLLALFLQAMYGAVDLLIVGKFAASADVNFIFIILQILDLLALYYY